MSLSRRHFVQTVGTGAAGLWIAGRGREAGLFDLSERAYAAETSPLILASNENPTGTPKVVLDAVRASFGEAGRYPFATIDEVRRLVAESKNVKPENVLLGSGSTQILRTTTHVFCSKTAPLVAPIPAYEECAGYAALMGYPVRTVKLTAPPELKMDLDAMLTAAKGGGMVFYCNPNNPVATAVDGKNTRQF
ncbi:MAG TPA: aminotransferase class I/II-fold pyridoxal phosphate-dependent enzyme, partial [Vicinamibacterales bacterium]|nr:aminotransferase class I/II-fold pyridoxal phosphate-dependent enzyme [Vicinamibacterales bacterium]